MKKNKFEANKKYFTISIYVIVVTFICALIVKAVMELGATISIIKGLLSILSPFLIGFLIAYLMLPFVNALYNRVFVKLFRQRQRGLCRLLSILVAYIIVVAVLIGLLVYIIPSLINSVPEIVSMFQDLYKDLSAFIDSLAEKYPSIDLDYVRSSVDNAFPKAIDIVTNFLSEYIVTIYGTSVSIIKWIINFVIAIIVSCYMLIDKGMMTRAAKRIVYAFFDTEKADFIWSTLKRSNAVFGEFIIGKTIDSLIIGCLCFVLMLIFKMPFALLISIVVAVTNMIPYFGPIIGAAPSALFIFVISPGKALAFIIMILVLQQIDGNFIGPKILGESTGLRPLWIIFAISVGGWCAGVIGMFLGVPCVAVISSLLNDVVSARLDEKNIDLPMVAHEKIRVGKKPRKPFLRRYTKQDASEENPDTK